MKVSVNYLHHQGTDWFRELEFYKEELAILTKRLEEIIERNTNKEVTAQVEHYQNKFIMLREQIDNLHHDITVREQNIENEAKAYPQHITEKLAEPTDVTLNRMKDLAQSIADTRFEFNRFLARTL